jgi:glycerol-3-phosphate dehydrogenase
MERFIESHKGELFDIVIIGGGITGAAVAYDAASRGLKVALVEKNDFGWATSAANSKLIHGGLRYLFYLEYGLVRESLRERRILSNIAPNFVYPIPFMVPNYDKLKNNKYVLKLGLTTYDVLAFDKKWTWDRSKRIPNHSCFSRKKTLAMAPGLKADKLTGSIMYYDCQSIAPERFTLAFIKSAMRHGAKAANYAKVEEFVYDDGKRVAGVKVRDLIKNRIVEVRGALTINCAGPWADIILNASKNGKGLHQIRRSEGIHVITRSLTDRAVTMMTPGGRHFFIIPWRGHSLIGTTDRDYEGDPDNYRVTRESIDDFLAEINQSFGDGKLSIKDVLFAYGGLRPLVDDQTEGTYATSRKYEIYNNALDGLDGLITVEGGKWTTSRNLAVNVLKMVQVKLKRTLPPSRTDNEYLAGCEIEDMKRFVSEAVAGNADFRESTVRYLVMNYGTEYSRVLAIAREDKSLAVPLSADGEIGAEVVYAIRYEMAKTLTDILMRRTGLGTLGDPGDAVVKKIARIAAKELKWNEARVKKEIAAAKQTLAVPR